MKAQHRTDAALILNKFRHSARYQATRHEGAPLPRSGAPHLVRIGNKRRAHLVRFSADYLRDSTLEGQFML